MISQTKVPLQERAVAAPVTNHYSICRKIEMSIVKSDRLLLEEFCIVFFVKRAQSRRIVVIQEVVQPLSKTIRYCSLIDEIRHLITGLYKTKVNAILLVKKGSLPRSQNGFIYRDDCRKLFFTNKLEIVEEWCANPRDRSSFLMLESDVNALLKSIGRASIVKLS